MKRNIVLLIAVGFFTLAQPARAQGIPANCLQKDGYADLPGCYPECYAANYQVDLRHCLTDAFWYIPPQALWHGYYDTFGDHVPFLPAERTDSFNPSNFLIGKATRYDANLMEVAFSATIKQFQFDPTSYEGGIALESCLKGYSAWIQLPGQPPSPKPFLVSDCRALIHKYGAACNFGSVVEMVYEKVGLSTDDGLISDVIVYLAPPGDLTFPQTLDQEQPLPYAESWLKEAKMRC